MAAAVPLPSSSSSSRATSSSTRRDRPRHQSRAPCLPRRPHVAVVAAAGRDGRGEWYQQQPQQAQRQPPPRRATQHSSSSSASSASSSMRSSSAQAAERRALAAAFAGAFAGSQPPARSASRSSDEDDADEEEEGPGWWEVPREARAAAGGQGGRGRAGGGGALPQLEAWQEQQLLLAATLSKKKVKVQELSANTGLDRSEVLAWIAEFRARPAAEQARLLEPLRPQLQAQREQLAQAAAQRRVDAAVQAPPRQAQQPWQHLGGDGDDAEAAAGGGGARLPFSAPNPDTGFRPFHERRAHGAAASSASASGRADAGPARRGAGRRLPGEVLRTLEGVYSRSPWPNREVVAGLFDLHRLPRELVLEWFEARRAMDGLPDNPRRAKQQAAAAAAAAAGGAGRSGARGPAAAGSPVSAAEAALAAGQPLPWQQPPQGQGPQEQEQQPQQMQSLTAREFAALRSGLPSPRKFKGAKLAQELGIKQVPAAVDARSGKEQQQVVISGVAFVTRDGAVAWRGAWRRRRAASGLPAQRLDFTRWFR